LVLQLPEEKIVIFIEKNNKEIKFIVRHGKLLFIMKGE